MNTTKSKAKGTTSAPPAPPTFDHERQAAQAERMEPYFKAYQSYYADTTTGDRRVMAEPVANFITHVRGVVNGVRLIMEIDEFESSLTQTRLDAESTPDEIAQARPMLGHVAVWELKSMAIASLKLLERRADDLGDWLAQVSKP